MKKLQDFLRIDLPPFVESAYELFFSQYSNIHTLVVGVSGGADSMLVLVSLYVFLRKHQNISIAVVHCNHKTRRNTDVEENMLLNFVHHVTEYHGYRYRGTSFSESDLRKRRWKCFEDVLTQGDFSH